jgi:hypothetical protein
MSMRTFEFKEGTIIASVSQEVEFDMTAGTITDTGRFTATLIGGTVPGIQATRLMDPTKKDEKIFGSEEAAYAAAVEEAVKMGYHPKKTSATNAKKPVAKKTAKKLPQKTARKKPVKRK